MTQASFSAKLAETVELIDCALDALEQGGDQPDLTAVQTLLGQQLIGCMHLVERDPGIEAAAADLFAAVLALVRDSAVGAQPPARKQRLFRDARLRFKGRLATARPSEHGTKIVWRHSELVRAA